MNIDDFIIAWMVGVISLLLATVVVNIKRETYVDWSDNSCVKRESKPYVRIYFLSLWTPFIKPFKSFIYPDLSDI